MTENLNSSSGHRTKSSNSKELTIRVHNPEVFCFALALYLFSKTKRNRDLSCDIPEFNSLKLRHHLSGPSLSDLVKDEIIKWLKDWISVRHWNIDTCPYLAIPLFCIPFGRGTKQLLMVSFKALMMTSIHRSQVFTMVMVGNIWFWSGNHTHLNVTKQPCVVSFSCRCFHSSPY